MTHSGLFLFAFSDNLISEDWFFAEGELFFMFLFQSPSISLLSPKCADFRAVFESLLYDY